MEKETWFGKASIELASGASDCGGWDPSSAVF